MALDTTLQETLLKKSVRKYFTDSLEIVSGVSIFFDTLYAVPKVNGVELDSWIIFQFGRMEIGTLSNMYLHANCFSRKDPSGNALCVLRDTLLNELLDENATDGKKKIPYLDSVGSMVTGIVPIVVSEFDNDSYTDGTKHKIVTVKLHWGTK